MKHIKALAIKFISSLVLLYVILGLGYGVSFGNVLLISLVLGIAAYIIGDMIILPRTNNIIATLADFGLAFFVIWLMAESLTFGNNMVTASLISAIGVALFEYFFHKYLSNQVIEKTNNNITQDRNLQYQTEASEEIRPIKVDLTKRDEK